MSDLSPATQAGTLRHILDPVEPASFFADYWERSLLHVERNEPEYYAGLLSIDAIDDILTSGESFLDDVRLAREADPVPPKTYSYNSRVSRPNAVDYHQLRSEYRSGSSVILNALHTRWKPLAEFCRELETCLSHRVQANAYLSPPGARGFGYHHDTHDVMVLQISGTKFWAIHEPAIDLPLPSQQLTEDKPSTPLACELELKAGDLLYLPRGFIHAARSSNLPSLHVTVGINAYTWIDLLRNIIDDFGETEPLSRSSLPVGFAFEQNYKTNISGIFKKLVDVIGSEQSLASGMERIAEEFVIRSRPLFDGGVLAEPGDTGLIDGATTVRRRSGLLARTSRDEDIVCLTFSGRKISVPLHVEPAIRSLVSGQAYRVADLPGPLDDAGKVTLARHLVAEGFLEICN